MGDIYIAAHLRRCLRHSMFGHVLQYTPSTSVLDALHLHHAIKSPPLRYPSPLHITFIEVKNELVKMKDVFPMKVITHTVTHQKKKTDIDTRNIKYQANFADRYIESKMYPANFAGRYIESKMYQANFAGGHIESKMYPANFAGRHIESKMYPANFAGGRSRLDLLLPSFLPSREETKMQERRKQSIDSGAEWHTPFMRQGERDAIWREAFLEQRSHVAVWRDRRLEEKSSHARLQLRTFGENSKPYKSSLVALSEQLRDIFAA